MNRVNPSLKRLGLYLAVAAAGFVGGGGALYLYLVRSGPPLSLWHTEKLTGEFTAQRAEHEIRTFEQYLRLEDELFLELDEQIYQRTESGPDFALARYSSGSLADPRGRDPNWNRSYEFEAIDPVGGVLLLHGMSDSPYSLRVLAETFRRQGYWVLGIRLPGHGTIPSGLRTVTWQDMFAAVQLAMRHLADRVGSAPLHMVGYSTGAPLALVHVLTSLETDDAEVLPASLVLISPSIGITPLAGLAKWNARFSKIPALEKLGWTDVLPEFDPFKYNSFAANAADQVHRLTRLVATRLRVRAAAGPIENFPRTLVFLSTVDATVSTDAVIDNLLRHLSPRQHELVLYDINRSRIKTTVLVTDPAPLTGRLMADDSLPFFLTLIANESPDSNTVVSRRKAPFSTKPSVDQLDLVWPSGVVSLSHVALPFPPTDPLYGRREFAQNDHLQLGQIDFQGERNLLKFPANWLLRLRYNPFFEILENRAIQWVSDAAGQGAADSQMQ